MYFPKFFYNDGADGAGGASGAAGNNTGTPEVVPPIITDDELKNYGLDRDQLKTLLQTHKESSIPVEQKQQEEQVKKANFIKFAAENGLMKVDDFSTYDSLKSRSNRELRFEKYLNEWKEDNPEVTDPEEIQSQAKTDFETEFRLNSENEKQKARGEARLNREAEELRNPHTSKYEKAQSAYNERVALEGKLPDFNKFIDSLIEKSTPEKITFTKVKDGGSELDVEVELSKKDREELAEKFRTPKTYRAWETEKDISKVESLVTKKINGFLKEKYFDQIVGKSFELGKGRGVKNGSNVGAEQPFSVIRGGESPSTEGNNKMTLEQSNQKIANARARYAR